MSKAAIKVEYGPLLLVFAFRLCLWLVLLKAVVRHARARDVVAESSRVVGFLAREHRDEMTLEICLVPRDDR
jgi:hypothetical protein